MSSIAILLVVSQEAFHMKRGVRDLERARAVAAAEGHQVVISVLPFCASEGTLAWLAEHAPSGWQVLRGEEDDLSAAISAWASASTCERLGVMGPDESVSAGWLAACAARPPSPRTAFHPEAVITYGPNFFDRGEMSLIALAPRLDRLAASAKSNPVPASFVAPRDVLVAHPYPRVDPGRGWGEPGWTHLMRWWWVNRLLVAGVEFEALQGAVYFRAMPDGEGPENLLTPGGSHLMGPYFQDAPEPTAVPRFQGWRMPPHQGPGELVLRARYRRELDKAKLHERQLEAARDFWKSNSDAWEKAATAVQRPHDPSGTGQGIGEWEATLAHANALRQAYLEDRDRWQARAEHFEAAYRAGLPHRIKAAIKRRLAGPLRALRRGPDRS